jgi:uncharacterized RDD family membrane protein YckC
LECPKCGRALPEGAESCPECGAPVGQSSEGQQKEPTAAPVRLRVAYAGFWFRAFALAIDFFIVCFTVGPTVVEPILIKNQVGKAFRDVLNFTNGGSRQSLALLLLLHLILWLYYASFESSRWQATPGKKLMGLTVTSLTGQRISFARASGRYFGKLLSQFLLIGFFLAAFTAKKQALHDMLAGCLVVRKI